MKTIIILAATLFASFNVSAVESAQDMLNNEVSQKPSAINLASPEGYTAEGVSAYEGRNKNRATENLTSQVKSGNSISRSMRHNGSVKDSQLENLESTAGELVQKVEDDRVKKAKNHKSRFDSNKAVLQKTYDIVADVNVNLLGSEQDPKIQNAFKCSNIKECNKNPKIAKGNTDARAIKNFCTKSQRLHWDGSKWSCLGLFAKISKPSCGAGQYAEPLNGGLACIDYIYEWGSNSYSSCNSSGQRLSIIKCFKKKKTSDRDVDVVADSNCLGNKPKETTSSCSSSWIVGSWSACSKTCGGGIQTRTVSCPSGKTCLGVKPATSQQCNTQVCSASWSVSPWGSCSKTCGGGIKKRTVTCPVGFSCVEAKPEEVQSCNTQECVEVLTWKESTKHSKFLGSCTLRRPGNGSTYTTKCHISTDKSCVASGTLSTDWYCGHAWDEVSFNKTIPWGVSTDIGKACTNKGEYKMLNMGSVRNATRIGGESFPGIGVFFVQCR